MGLVIGYRVLAFIFFVLALVSLTNGEWWRAVVDTVLAVVWVWIAQMEKREWARKNSRHYHEEDDDYDYER